MRSLILLGVLAFSQFSMAWGVLGHRTVATISVQFLNPQSKAALAQILGNQDPAAASTWADEIKSDHRWAHTKSYHYASTNNGETYLGSVQKQVRGHQAHGDIVMAIITADAMLRDPRVNAQGKASALRFLIHLVGDLFQPLHTGPGVDRGGNEVDVNWLGRQTNLHSLWDGALLETLYGRQLGQLPQQSQDKWLAQALLQKYPSRLTQQCEMDLMGWFMQSMTARASAYSLNPNNAQAYVGVNGKVIEYQIVQAGLALACSLNSIFTTGQQPTPKQLSATQAVNQALGGNLFSLVRLLPQ